MRQSTRQKKKKNRSRNRGVLAVTAVVLALLIALSIHTSSLKREDEAYAARVEALQAQVAAESQRAAELEEKSIYVQTRDYIEQIARERLGLVIPDETIIRPEE